jgi:hypothetical protein
MIGDDPFDFNVAYEEGHGFWGKGCVIGSTLLKDELSGKEYSIKELADNKQNIVVKSYDTVKHKITNCETGVPFSKGIAKIFKVRTKSGNEIIVSNEHKFYSKGVWLPLSELKVGDKILINNVEKEKSRREKISYSTIGKPKSENHKKNMKLATNKGRFSKDSKPLFDGSMLTKQQKQSISDKLKNRKLSAETRHKMSVANKGLKNHKIDCLCLFCRTKRGEYKVFRTKEFCYAGQTMRSSWEVKFAKHLDEQMVSYEYEPRSFQLSDGTRYIPDFFLPTENLWVEIKGRMERTSEDKMKLFIKEYGLNFVILRHIELKEIGIL